MTGDFDDTLICFLGKAPSQVYPILALDPSAILT